MASDLLTKANEAEGEQKKSDEKTEQRDVRYEREWTRLRIGPRLPGDQEREHGKNSREQRKRAHEHLRAPHSYAKRDREDVKLGGGSIKK